MLKIFCWVCYCRRQFHLQKHSTLAVCTRCGNPEGAMKPLIPVELALRDLKPLET